ncbi:MAG: T9SS type A sorting domain-containing protein [Ignavibacteria bacterium]|nr:T9SS type A sorting domain-containing protein [Ignavibacteria bacterium]
MKNLSKGSFVILLFLLTTTSFYSQWQQTSLNSGNIRALAGDEENIFAARSTLYRSTDGGTSWFPAGLSSTIQDIYLEGQLIFAATQNAGLYRSSNLGVNWVQYNMGADGVRSVTSTGNFVFAGQQNYGMMKSENAGVNWMVVSGVQGSIPALASNGSTIFAGTHGIYRSVNNGVNWQQTLTRANLVYAIAINDNRVYAGFDNEGVHISSDNGLTWVQSSLNSVDVISLAVTGNNVFAGTFDNGIYYSGNSGLSWMQINEGLTGLDVESLLINGNYIFAGTYDQGLFKRSLSEVLNINNLSSEIPKAYTLHQNYPNPFNPVTNINFSVPKTGVVKLTVFDAAGRETATLLNGRLSAGTYNYDFDASQLPSGIYFYKLESNDFSQTKKMILVK